ncbi:pimeloyl-ACP methyl ester carboxylesterase [Georgenia soli]|uniref:Pimeloyl-ACP methyl ester carboxylesterase n=1 Tax=Georgenia soli TaxID=638953 RepID=A0A2A9ENT4_9MICO|nr:alpha/beta hydrolase [Georgenia soli]PFG40453.1 pimeloyl-ACP methyl ester carboxylesterase [Georgenia soli]
MSAPTVVLVHGIRASRTMWLRQLAALDAAGVPAVAPDLPGHGVRAGEDFSVAGALDTIESVVAGIEGPFVVAGLSLGGYLTLHWAARTTRRPEALLAASCTTQPRGPGLSVYRRLAALIARLPDGGAGLNDLMARRFLPEPARADLAAGGMTMSVMSAALEGMAQVDALADVARIDVPIWFVNGRWDHFRGHERRFLAAARQGRLVVVPGATHLVSLVRPVAFNRVLLDLVDEVASDRADAVTGPADHVPVPAGPRP